MAASMLSTQFRVTEDEEADSVQLGIVPDSGGDDSADTRVLVAPFDIWLSQHEGTRDEWHVCMGQYWDEIAARESFRQMSSMLRVLCLGARVALKLCNDRGVELTTVAYVKKK